MGHRLQQEGEKLRAYFKHEKDALVAKGLALDEIPDVTAEEGLYSEVLSRISADVSKLLPAHADLLKSILEWYVETPVDRLMQARKEKWRRPHREAFEMLETEVYNSQRLAESSQVAERRVRNDNRDLQREMDELNERYRENLSRTESLQAELNSTLKSSADHAGEARVLRELSNSQGSSLVELRNNLEKALKDLIKEQKDKKGVEDKAKIQRDTIARLEGEILKLRPTTPNREHVRRYRKRNKEILESIKVVQDEQRRASKLQADKKEDAADLMHQIQTEQANAYNRPDQAKQLFALETIAHNLKDFSDMAAQSDRDRTVAIARVGELVSLLQNADPFSDSDTDEDAPPQEEEDKEEHVIQDPALLRVKCKGLEQHIQLKDSEILIKIGEADLYKREMASIQDIRRQIEEQGQKVVDELTKLKADSKKKQEDMLKKIDALEMKNSEVSAKLDIKTLDVMDLRKEKKMMEAQMSTLNLEAGAYKTKIESLEIALKDMQIKVDGCKEAEADAKKMMAEMDARVLDADLKIYEATKKMMMAEDATADLQATLSGMAGNHVSTESELKRLRAAEMTLTQELEAYKKAAESNKNNAINTIESKLAEAKGEIADLKAKVAKLEKDGGKGGGGKQPATSSPSLASKSTNSTPKTSSTVATSPVKSTATPKPTSPMLSPVRDATKPVSPEREAKKGESDQKDAVKEYVKKNRFAKAVKSTMHAAMWASSYQKIKMPKKIPVIEEVINEELVKNASEGNKEALTIICLNEEVMRLTERLSNLDGTEDADGGDNDDDDGTTGDLTVVEYVNKKKFSKIFKGTVLARRWTSYEGVSLPDEAPDIDSIINEELIERANHGDEAALMMMCLHEEAERLNEMIKQSKSIATLKAWVRRGSLAKVVRSSIHAKRWAASYGEVIVPKQVPVIEDVITEELVSQALVGDEEAFSLISLFEEVMRLNEELDAANISPYDSAVARNDQEPSDGQTVDEYVKSNRFAKAIGFTTSAKRWASYDEVRLLEHHPDIDAIINEGLIDRANLGDGKALMIVCLREEIERLNQRINKSPPLAPRVKSPSSIKKKSASREERSPQQRPSSVNAVGFEFEEEFEELAPLTLKSRSSTGMSLGPRKASFDEVIVSPSRKRSSVYDTRIEMIERKMSTPKPVVAPVQPLESKKMALLGPWMAPPSTAATEGSGKVPPLAGTGDLQPGVGDLIVSGEHLLELAKGDMGGKDSISERMLLFRAAANARFRVVSQGDMNAAIPPQAVARMLVSHGFDKEEARAMMTSMVSADGANVNAESFVGGMLKSQAIALYSRMSATTQDGVDCATAVGMLLELGYSHRDSAEFVSRADPDNSGVIYKYHWVEAFLKYLAPPSGSLPRSLPDASGVALAGSPAPRPGKSQRSARHSVAPDTAAPPLPPPPASDSPAGAADEAGLSAPAPLAGGEAEEWGSWTLSGKSVKPTPIGLLLEAKEVLMAKMERELDQMRSEMTSLWKFVKDSIDQHTMDRGRLRQRIDAAILETQRISFRDLHDASTVMMPGDFPIYAASSSGGGVQQGCVADSVLVADVKIRSGTGHSIIVPPNLRMAKLSELLEDRSAMSSRKPRTLIWLVRTIYTMLDEKVLFDLLDLQHGSRPQDFSLFVVTFFKKRFGLENLVRQNLWDFHNTLEDMPTASTLVRLVYAMCNASFSTGQQSSLIQAWGILATASGDSSNKEGHQSRRIHTDKAIQVCRQVLPYATSEQMNRVEARVRSVGDSIDDYSLLETIVGWFFTASPFPLPLTLLFVTLFLPSSPPSHLSFGLALCRHNSRPSSC